MDPDGERLIVLEPQVSRTVPTLAALSLLEMDKHTAAVDALMRQVLGKPLARFQVRLPTSVLQLTTGPGGEVVAVATEDGAIYLWRPPHGSGVGGEARVLARDIPRVSWIRFHDSGHRLLAASQDGSARVWDLQNGDKLHVFSGHGGRLWRAQFDPGGHRRTRSWAPGAASGRCDP